MDWEKFRREDNSLDLMAAFKDENPEEMRDPKINKGDAFAYLKLLEKTHPIKSRQTATLAITAALFMLKY